MSDSLIELLREAARMGALTIHPDHTDEQGALLAKLYQAAKTSDCSEISVVDEKKMMDFVMDFVMDVTLGYNPGMVRGRLADAIVKRFPKPERVSVDLVKAIWNARADFMNQWENLGGDEKNTMCRAAGSPSPDFPILQHITNECGGLPGCLICYGVNKEQEKQQILNAGMSYEMPDGRPIFGEGSPHNIGEHLAKITEESDGCRKVFESAYIHPFEITRDKQGDYVEESTAYSWEDFKRGWSTNLKRVSGCE